MFIKVLIFKKQIIWNYIISFETLGINALKYTCRSKKEKPLFPNKIFNLQPSDDWHYQVAKITAA
jgi:hypothetical protein